MGHLFLKRFVVPFFSPTDPPNGLNIAQKSLKKHTFPQHVGPHFLLLFTVLRGHGASQDDSKCAPELHQKSNRFSNLKKSPPKLPKGAQKGEGETGLAPLGAPLAPQSVFWHEKCIQRAPKVTPRCLQGPKISSKMIPKVQKMTPTVPNMTLKVLLKINSLGTRFKARRTARSD